MAKGWFVFNGIDSREYGLLVTGVNPYAVPMRDVTAVSVPGRDGDVLIDNGRYKNVSITYHCEIRSGSPLGFSSAFEGFRRKLTTSYGYHRLEDSYNNGLYRIGYLVADVSPAAKGTNWSGGVFDITFSCRPGLYDAEENDPIILPVVVGGSISDSGDNAAHATMRRTTFIPVRYDGKFTLFRYTSGLTGDVYVYEYDGAKSYIKKDKLMQGLDSYLCAVGTEYIRIAWIPDDGDTWLDIEDDDRSFRISSVGVSIKNETPYPSDPTIIIRRDSTDKCGITINGSFVYIASGCPSMDIVIDAFNQTITDTSGVRMDQYVSIFDDPNNIGSAEGSDYADGFPSIAPGYNLVYTRYLNGGGLSSIIQSVEITPNYWRY